MSKVLIVSQFVETRVPLQRCVETLAGVSEIASVHNFAEAESVVRTSREIRYIFIADAFEELDSATFLEFAKKSRSAQEATCILIVGSALQASYIVAQRMLVGFHGFLFEPISIATAEEAVMLADAVRRKQSASRLRAAAGLILNEVLEAEQNEHGKTSQVTTSDGTKSAQNGIWTKVQQSCEKFKEITGQSVTTTVVKEFRELPPSERVPGYRGASSRVRSLFEKRLKAKLAGFHLPRKGSPE